MIFFLLIPGTALTTNTSSPAYSHSTLDTVLYKINDDQLNKIQFLCFLFSTAYSERKLVKLVSLFYFYFTSHK
jgi:hypothetical protein